MKKLNCSDLIQLNKAVLSPEVVQCLESLQADDNLGLQIIRDDLANAVCFLGRCAAMLDEDDQQEINQIITALSQTRRTIEELQNPVAKLSK